MSERRTDNVQAKRATILLQGFPEELAQAVREACKHYPDIVFHTQAKVGTDYDVALTDADNGSIQSGTTRGVISDADIQSLRKLKKGIDVSEDADRERLIKRCSERLLAIAHTMLPQIPSDAHANNADESLDDILRDLTSNTENDIERITLMLIGIDGARDLLDSLSEHTREQIAQVVDARIKGSVRSYDRVVRVSDTQFAIILRNQNGHPHSAATNLVDTLRPAIRFEGNSYHLITSIGMSEYPSESDNANALVRHSSMALSRARERGGNCYDSYDSIMSVRLSKRWAVEEKLRKALDNQEFTLNYHPIVNSQDGGVIGVESLLRWDDPERGRIFPDQFIPVLEETGMIIPVGEWVLYESCHQLHLWQEQHNKSLRLNVNISPKQLDDPQFLQKLTRILKGTGIAPQQLCLEITENVLLGHSAKTLDTLTGIGELGVNLYIDDFGTGFSSMTYLKRLPVNGLKIDKSFIDDIPDDANSTAIALAILNLGRDMKLQVIPEGVETAEQANFLANSGADLVQGFYFSKPLPAAHIGKLLERNAKLPTTLPPLVSEHRLYNTRNH